MLLKRGRARRERLKGEEMVRRLADILGGGMSRWNGSLGGVKVMSSKNWWGAL
jgi:hypothetical protein